MGRYELRALNRMLSVLGGSDNLDVASQVVLPGLIMG